jgi:acetoacetyl-CoA synthetase
MTTSGSQRRLLWEPSKERVAAARMTAYLEWLARERGLHPGTYDELWRWSVDDLDGFWRSVWDWFEVPASAPPTAVLGDRRMPGAQWFPGARLNWAEGLLRHADAAGGDRTAVVGLGEDGEPVELSWAELTARVASVAAALRELGVRPGDRVAAYLPNIPQAVVALLATTSVGAIWSCCAPDFGTKGVIDRFQQIAPTVLIAVDGYRFGGRDVDRTETVAELRQQLPSVRHTVVVRHLHPDRPVPADAVPFDALTGSDAAPAYQQVPFDHPLWILYSSGTTGLPKGIVHGHGGILLEHLKLHGLHLDSGPGDRVFIFASTAWMVWNTLVSALSVGATVICYDGSPVAPQPDAMFAVCAEQRATRFGTGAAYLTICERAGARPGDRHDLSALRSIMSTGSPLPDSAWHWVYDAVKSDLLLGSDCGGTDVCTAFIGTNPLLPVYAGEMQAPYLGVRVESWSEAGRPVVGEVGDGDHRTDAVHAGGVLERPRRRPLPGRVLRHVPRGVAARRLDDRHRARHLRRARPVRLDHQPGRGPDGLRRHLCRRRRPPRGRRQPGDRRRAARRRLLHAAVRRARSRRPPLRRPGQADPPSDPGGGLAPARAG